MTPWINYHHLFYFKKIAEEGSVSKAAKELRLGQPTLSAQLKQFEESLGLRLFERQNRRLILTEQGKVALDYAKNIFQLGSEMYEVLHDRLKSNRLTLHIGALDSIPKQVLLQMVQFAYSVSRCQISLSEGKSDELLRELIAHRIDILVTNFLPNGVDAKGLLPRAVAKNNVAFYGAMKFKSLRKGFPYSISGAPIIVPTYDSKLRFDLDHWAKVHEIELNIVAESQDVGMKKLMAVSELGLIATASHTVTRQMKAGELIRIGQLQGVHEELFIIKAQRKISNQLANRVWKSFNV